jgi:3-methyladenine DNA glycosylase AlkD
MSRDYNNLQFILNKSQDELLDWWESLDDEDQCYAMEIISAYKQMLNEPAPTDLSEARGILAKYTLKG